MLLIAAATTTLRTNSLALFLCSPELHKFLCGSFVESIQKKLDIQDCKDANGKQDANGKAFAKQSPRRLPIRFRRPDLGVPCIDCHRGPTSLGPPRHRSGDRGDGPPHATISVRVAHLLTRWCVSLLRQP